MSPVNGRVTALIFITARQTAHFRCRNSLKSELLRPLLARGALRGGCARGKSEPMSHVALNYPHSSSGNSELSGDGRIFSKVRNSGPALSHPAEPIRQYLPASAS